MKGRTLHDVLHEGLIRRTARFQHFTLLPGCRKFTHSCRLSQVSERREGKRERQVMLPLVLLMKFFQLLIIFQISFSFNLLVANWRRSPEFWLPKLFSLAMATERWVMTLAWNWTVLNCRVTPPVGASSGVSVAHLSCKSGCRILDRKNWPIGDERILGVSSDNSE